MSQRLGSGEFERTDVEVLQSTMQARCIFLKILQIRKHQWAYDLLRLFNNDYLPEELTDPRIINARTCLFLKHLADESFSKVEMFSNLIDTPLSNFYRFFYQRRNEVERLENEDKEKLNRYIDKEDVNRRRKILSNIIADWNNLKTIEGSNPLCESIENWAKNYNLNEEWLLDFALSILCVFKAELDYSLTDLRSAEQEDFNFNYYAYSYEQNIRSSISSAIYDFWDNSIGWKNWEKVDCMLNLPPFEYKWKDFELPKATWFPDVTLRREFTNKRKEELTLTIANLKSRQENWKNYVSYGLSKWFKEIEEYLNRYCDFIEQQMSNGVEQFNSRPTKITDMPEKIWQPSQQSREDFIEQFIEAIKLEIDQTNKAIKSLETFTNSHFNSKLIEYCQSIEKSLPKNYSRTPQKYSNEKHFEWLVDFQVVPTKSFTEIAYQYKVDRKTVNEPVRELAEKIGITLRKATKSGRPKGSKNSETSQKQLGVLKK